ncbi:MAG: hypothetical protein K6F93_02480 [Lachnospiraceae bacterium]|nr:hypothetical protein [Lachnospiraceae bacterium]
MNYQKYDLLIDLAYVLSFSVVLILFISRFSDLSGVAGRIFEYLGSVENMEPMLLIVLCIKEVCYSCAVFAGIFMGSVVIHESGHALGGILRGYGIAHFCVFGIVFSLKGKKKVRFDVSAVFGGYVVACNREKTADPVILLRMGPWAECFYIVAASLLTYLGSDTLCGIFVLGELSAYEFIRVLSAVRGRNGDSSTAGEVLCEGPEDYNMLMDVYDKVLSGISGRRIIAVDAQGRNNAAKSGAYRGVGEKSGEYKVAGARKLSIKEELELYYGKEQL